MTQISPLDHSKACSEGFDVLPLSPGVAAEIRGLDLARPMASGALAALRQALGTYGVLFFRDQDISPEAHIAFARGFGTININRFFEPVASHPEIAEVRREPDQRGATGWYWHTDHSYDEAPASHSSPIVTAGSRGMLHSGTIALHGTVPWTIASAIAGCCIESPSRASP